MASSLGSNVAHVRPIQIQPTGVDVDKSGSSDKCEQSSVCAHKDPCISFENIITIAPIEDEPIYKTVTVNINGVTKDVKVPITRSENNSNVATRPRVSEALTNIHTTKAVSSAVQPVIIRPSPTPVSLQNQQSASAGRSLLSSPLPSLGARPRSSGVLTAASSATMLYVTSTPTLVTSSKPVNSGSGNRQTSSNSTAVKILSTQGVSGNVNHNITNNISLPLQGGTPGFLGSDGKFYVQVDTTKLKPYVGATSAANSSFAGNTFLIKQPTVQAPVRMVSSAKQAKPVTSVVTNVSTNPAYTLKYMNSLRTLQPTTANKNKTLLTVSKNQTHTVVSLPNEAPNLRIDSIFSLSDKASLLSVPSTQTTPYQVLRNTLTESTASKRTLSSSSQPRKKFLGTIDISTDDDHETSTTLTPTTTVPPKSSDQQSAVESPLSIAKKFGKTLVSIIGNISDGKTQPSTQVNKLQNQPTSKGAGVVQHPRNTARKSFGRFKRNRSFDVIKARFPELRDLQVSVERLDMAPRKLSIDVNKLKGYLKSRRLIRRRNGQKTLKKSKRKQNQDEKDPPKRNNVDNETPPVKPEKKPNVVLKDATESELDRTIDACAKSVSSDPKASQNMIKSHNILRDALKRKEEQDKDRLPSSTTKLSSVDNKSKFLLIKTSHANYLMPVQSDVSPMTVANQISKKTTANVTVVSSANMTPIVSSSIVSQNVARTPTHKTPSALQPLQPLKLEPVSPNTGPTSCVTSSSAPQTIQFLISPSVAQSASLNTEQNLLGSTGLSPTISQTPILSSMKASLLSPPNTGSKKVVVNTGSKKVVVNTGSKKVVANTSTVSNTQLNLVISTSKPEKKRTGKHRYDDDDSSTDSAQEFEPTVTQASKKYRAAANPGTHGDEASTSTDEAKPKSSVDRIKALRAMLKQQEEALEGARRQREKTNKVLMDMD